MRSMAQHSFGSAVLIAMATGAFGPVHSSQARTNMKSNKRSGIVRWAYVVFAMALALVSTLTTAQGQAEFSEWSLPVNLGSPINTGGTEVGPHISKNGLSLYYLRNFDVFVSQRATVDDAWGARQSLGTNINTTFNEASPSLSLDEHVLLFASERPGGFGGFDLYVSRRHNRRDDLGWQSPVNLGDGVNTPADELHATLFEDDATGVITVYFSSNRPDGLGGDDIYASILQPDETFGPAMLVGELSTASNDGSPCIRRDGLEMLLTSDRPGTLGGLDLWVSTRATTTDPWSAPINLGSLVNTAAMDAGSALSCHGTELYFSSNRPGGFGSRDLYRSTRSKLGGTE